jgi:hypothetical protein
MTLFFVFKFAKMKLHYQHLIAQENRHTLPTGDQEILLQIEEQKTERARIQAGESAPPPLQDKMGTF